MKTIVFHPEVFVFSDEESFLLYNTHKGNSREIARCDFWDKLFLTINSINSLYRYAIPEKDWGEYYPTITEICQEGYAAVYEQEEPIPFSYAPIPKLDVDLPAIKLRHKNGEGGFILSFVRTIGFYLDGKMDLERVRPFLSALDYCYVTRVEVFLEDPLLGDYYSPLFHHFESEYNNCHIQLKASSWDTDSLLFFAQSHPKWQLHLRGTVEELSPFFGTVPLRVFVRNEAEQALADHLHPEEIIPKYDGQNIDYLRSTLFTIKEDLTGSSKRDIFIRQTLNSNYFGRLLVFSNGEVRAGRYGALLGTTETPLYEMVYKELISEESLWMLHRDKTDCKDCRFRYLCPCVSDFELSLGNYRLCWRNGFFLN
jgi:hypothetical protein